MRAIEQLTQESRCGATTGVVPLKNSRKGWVYISGPISGYPDHNFPAFNALAEKLRSQGHKVINPADHGIVEGAEWEDYLRADIALLARCESLHVLPGWENSRGAKLEIKIAEALHMEIVFVD